MTTSQTLAEITDNTRDLLYFYLSKIDKSLWYETPEVDGKIFNSVAWELCHIVWAQDFLILRDCANRSYKNLKLASLQQTLPNCLQ